eukprot:4335417-Pleurochrysis_carterae.AAC.2
MAVDIHHTALGNGDHTNGAAGDVPHSQPPTLPLLQPGTLAATGWVRERRPRQEGKCRCESSPARSIQRRQKASVSKFLLMKERSCFARGSLREVSSTLSPARIGCIASAILQQKAEQKLAQRMGRVRAPWRDAVRGLPQSTCPYRRLT